MVVSLTANALAKGLQPELTVADITLSRLQQDFSREVRRVPYQGHELLSRCRKGWLRHANSFPDLRRQGFLRFAHCPCSSGRVELVVTCFVQVRPFQELVHVDLLTHPIGCPTGPAGRRSPLGSRGGVGGLTVPVSPRRLVLRCRLRAVTLRRLCSRWKLALPVYHKLVSLVNA